MKVKELDRTVNITWSPIQQQPVLLAAGTAAQQLDASFSTSAVMEIYGLNLGEPGLDLELKGSTSSQSRFHHITWGGWGFSTDHLGGVIVGGCDGGRVQMYSASRLLAGEEGLIATPDRHSGPVRTIDFNVYQTNILASGASDSEIFIWDLNNTATPMSPGTKSQPNEDVLWLAWNKQVQHILASTFSQRCVIYDLRKSEPIIKLSDNTSRVRWKVVEWHPAVATQLCLASEDDSNPVVQLWDLRFATTPIKTLEGHSKGLLSIAWCPQDPDLLIGSGKDNKILCWNPNADERGGEVVCELMTSYQWNFEVAWCPRNPSLVASCSFDGHASIHSLTGGQQQVQTSKKIADSFPGMEQYADAPLVQPPVHGQPPSAAELRKAPKWLRRPVGASFGFGGKLVAFNSESRSVVISQVISEPDLLDRSHNLQVALSSGRFDEICASKTDEIWSYVSATLQQSPRAAIKKLLGFNQNSFELNKFIGEPANARLKDMEKITEGIGSLGGQGGREEEFDTFSNNLGTTNGVNFANNNPQAFNEIGSNQSSCEKKLTPFTIPTGDDVEGMISKALLAGNIEVAVELCLQQSRMADAVILAMTAGSDLLAKTQYRYFQQSKGNLSELIGAVVTEDWNHVVNSCSLSSWKEALAAVLTYSKDEELPVLCETLGQRLEKEDGDGLVNAQICYIAARNLSKLIKLRTRQSLNLTTSKLQELVEMVIVLQRGVRVDGGEGESEAAKLMSRYAELLAAQGELDTALSYLHDPQQENLIELHERLQCALGHKPAYLRKQSVPVPSYYKTSNLQSSSFNRRSSSHSVSGSWPQGGVVSQPNTPPANTSKQFNHMYHPQPHQLPTPLPSSVSAASKPLPPPPALYNPNTAQPAQPYNQPNQVPMMPINSDPPLIPGANAPLVPAPAPAPAPAPPMFNPASSFISQMQPFNPPGSVAAPPLPPSSGAAPPLQNRSNPSPGPGIQQGRQKYVIDPSVCAGPTGLSYRNQIQPPAPMSLQQPQLPLPPQPQAMVPPTQDQPYNPTEFRSQAYAPQHPGPAGWNDPPVISSPARNQPKVELPPQAPITHPLYGTAPEPNQMNTYQPQHYGGGAVNGGYGDPPPSVMQQQFPPQQQTLQPQQPQQYSQMSYNQPPKQAQPSSVAAPAVTKAAEPPQPKPPIPEEYVYLQTVFEELRNRCSCAANNPQSKRKLEEVARKLEMLYDALRENKLSPGTLSGLHQLVQLVQTGDYTGGLALHTQLISGPDFSQIASFMPGLKILLQSALQLGVYLQ